MYIIILNYTFELLFDPQGFSLGALLGLKTGLHRVHGPSMVLPAMKQKLTISAGQLVMLLPTILELLLLLSNPSVNLLAQLAQLQLSPQHLKMLSFCAQNFSPITLFSSCSRAPSASSKAPCSSSFSTSSLLLCLSSSWMDRPPSPSWSSRSLISSARF